LNTIKKLASLFPWHKLAENLHRIDRHRPIVMAKTRVKIDHFFYFLAQFFSGENDVLGIILQCSPQREARLRLGSIAAALVDSP